MSFSQNERHALCDLLDELGPGAPTLCEGWKTHDLAAHLWLRETDPLAAPGMFAKPLEGLTERRMESIKAKLDYAELVQRLRKGPVTFSLFSLPGMDAAANGVEFFVHHEDIRRAQGGEAAPRQLGVEDEEAMWKRLATMGRAMFRRSEVGVVAERTDLDVPAGGEPQQITLKPDEPQVVLRGLPSELVLFAFGRGEHAELDYVGAEADVATLKQTTFGM